MKEAIAWGVLIAVIWAAGYCTSWAITAWRANNTPAPHIPPAPDNQPGTDPEDLWTCRRIWAASHTTPRKEKPQP